MFNAFLLLVLVVAPVSVAQPQTATPCVSVAGAWRLAELLDREQSKITPGSNLYLYTDTHYSITLVAAGAEPRKPVPPPATPGQPTDAEKVAAYEHWAPLTAQAGTYQLKDGTYQLKDGTLTTRIVVAKGEHMRDITDTRQCTIEGTSMIHTFKNGSRWRFVRATP
jgi:hypothetical protein